MAKAMPYQDQFGNSYEDSYWRVAQINVGIADRNANATFYGYKDADAREHGKQPIGSKSYSISAAGFDTLYAAHVATGGPNLVAMAYQAATNAKDVVVDPNDLTKNVSFFEDAENV